MPNPYPQGRACNLHLQDYQIWAEIDYLDLPTDYRECLPGSMPPPDSTEQPELTLLDPHTPISSRHTGRSRLLWVGLTFTLINLLILAYLLYQFIDPF